MLQSSESYLTINSWQCRGCDWLQSANKTNPNSRVTISESFIALHCSSIFTSNRVVCILLIVLRDSTCFEEKERIPIYTLLKPERIFCSTADETFWQLWGKTGIKTWSIDYFLCSTTKHLDDSDVYVSPVYWSQYPSHYICTITDSTSHAIPSPISVLRGLAKQILPAMADWDGYCASLLPLPWVPLKKQLKPKQMTLFFKNQNLPNTSSCLKWLLLLTAMTKAVSTKQYCLSKPIPFLQTSLAFQIICSDKHQFSMWNFPY